MPQLPPSFRRLRWKLTLSYTLVTVAALAAVLCAGFLLQVGVTALLPDRIVRQLADEVAPQLAPAFAGPQPDLAAIDRWFQGTKRTDLDGRPAVVLGPIGFTEPGARVARVLVLDPEGRLLGAVEQDAAPAAPTPLDRTSVPGLAGVLPAALAGDHAPGRLRARPTVGRLTVAVPVRDGAGAVRGALVYSGPFSPLAAPPGVLAARFARQLLGFTLAAGLIGALFGGLTARWLTRRLDRVAAATTAWGAGDFSRAIADPSADELGQLGRRLDGLAAALQELIAARQRLAIVDERTRLARDLHDSVKQQVFALSMNLGAARALWERDPAAARARLDAAFALARQSQAELTAVLQTLRPVGLEGKGLRQALGEQVARWGEQTRIAAAYAAEGEGELPLGVEEGLFRLAQEALANVARHSGATAARVALTLGGDGVTLAVRDNGRGFDARRRAAGYGLATMRERAAALGGRVAIESGADGTTVTAWVPRGGEEGR